MLRPPRDSETSSLRRLFLLVRVEGLGSFVLSLYGVSGLGFRVSFVFLSFCHNRCTVYCLIKGCWSLWASGLA